MVYSKILPYPPLPPPPLPLFSLQKPVWGSSAAGGEVVVCGAGSFHLTNMEQLLFLSQSRAAV